MPTARFVLYELPLTDDGKLLRFQIYDSSLCFELADYTVLPGY